MKTAELRSNFAEGAGADTSAWTLTTGVGDLPYDGVSLDASELTTLTSVSLWDLTNSWISIEAVPDELDAARFYFLRTVLDENNYAQIGLLGDNPGALKMTVRQAGVDAFLHIDFDSTTMNHWRIREEYGFLYFETSVEGSYWTVHWIYKHSLDLQNVSVVISVGQYEFTESDGYGDMPFGYGEYLLDPIVEVE